MPNCLLQFDGVFSFFSSEPNLLVRACNQLGQFLTHRETNLRYLALESMCLLATSEFSHDAVKKHQVTFFWRFLILRSIHNWSCSSIQKHWLKICSRNWKLPKIEGYRNWRLQKLKVAKIDHCQIEIFKLLIAKIAKIEVAKLLDCKVSKVTSFLFKE